MGMFEISKQLFVIKNRVQISFDHFFFILNNSLVILLQLTTKDSIHSIDISQNSYSLDLPTLTFDHEIETVNFDIISHIKGEYDFSRRPFYFNSLNHRVILLTLFKNFFQNGSLFSLASSIQIEFFFERTLFFKELHNVH